MDKLVYKETPKSNRIDQLNKKGYFKKINSCLELPG